MCGMVSGKASTGATARSLLKEDTHPLARARLLGLERPRGGTRRPAASHNWRMAAASVISNWRCFGSALINRSAVKRADWTRGCIGRNPSSGLDTPPIGYNYHYDLLCWPHVSSDLRSKDKWSWKGRRPRR